MNMTLNFWLELIAIVLLFALVIYVMPRIRNYSLRKQQAINLRVRISERINGSLPIIASVLTSVDPTGDTNTGNALEFALQRLKALMTESSVLYSDESERVQRFIDAMGAVMVDLESGGSRRDDVEDLLLSGQRILLDLKENGLLRPAG